MQSKSWRGGDRPRSCITREGLLDDAAASFRRALDLQPESPRIHTNLAEVLFLECQWAEAEQHCRKALALKPDYAEVYSTLGAVLTSQGRLDEAVAALHSALQIAPPLTQAHINLGIAAMEGGDVREAIACYERALKPKGQPGDAPAELPIAPADKHEQEQAAAHCNQPPQLNTEHFEAQFGRAVLQLLTGDFRNGWAGYECAGGCGHSKVSCETSANLFGMESSCPRRRSCFMPNRDLETPSNSSVTSRW